MCVRQAIDVDFSFAQAWRRVKLSLFSGTGCLFLRHHERNDIGLYEGFSITLVCFFACGLWSVGPSTQPPAKVWTNRDDGICSVQSVLFLVCFLR